MSEDAAARADARPRPVLVLNAGSSTLKASLLRVRDGASPLGLDAELDGAAVDPRRAELSTTIEWGAKPDDGTDVAGAVASVLAKVRQAGVSHGGLAGVAHRVVLARRLSGLAYLVDDEVVAEIEAAAPHAPLHNPLAAAVIRAACDLLPGIPQVAVLDTAFHADLPEVARRYPLPAEWEAWGLQRHGFHGLSVAWAAARASALLRRPRTGLNLVVAHLGSGCSVTAVQHGRSVATSMGLTPLEGVMMGTRAGSIDPGILLAVLRDGRRTVDALADDLGRRAGLLGVSGRSADLRVVERAAEEDGDPRARLAIAMFVDRAAAGIAAAATALPSVDGLVFTGGIGEHAGAVRSRIVERLGVLGIAAVTSDETGADRILATVRGMDAAAEEKPALATEPAPVPSPPAVLRIEAREDVVAALATLALLRGPAREAPSG